ncbi:MAG TPA: NUDIX domain-containing protein [Devosiaceae bacterium]|nr:NUDIX domain-containing protein [Devosiaceae bacterium]
MRNRVKIVSEEVLSRNWGILKRTAFDFQRRDGSWQRQVRETYDRGPAAAVLLHDAGRGKITLVRQFRFPLYAQGKDAWPLEVCAGLLDGDDPETCVRREAEEEAGIRLRNVRHVFDVEMSPGSVIETISCFVGAYDAQSRVSDGGGLHQEGEDIEVIELALPEALMMIDDGRIVDAKTILLLQWLALHPAQ